MLVYFRCRRCRTAQSADVSQSGNPMVCTFCKGELLVPSASELAPFPVAAAAPKAVVLAPANLSANSPPSRSRLAPIYRASGRFMASFASRITGDRITQLTLGPALVVTLLIAGIVAAKWLHSGDSQAAPGEDETFLADAQDGNPVPRMAWDGLAGNEEEEETPGVLAVDVHANTPPTAEDVRNALRIPEKPTLPAAGKEKNKNEKPRDAANGVAELAVTHRRDLSEEDLRKQLLWSPEVGLTPNLIPDVIYGFKNQIESCDGFNEERNMGPLYLLETSKLARQLASRRGQQWYLDKKSADDASLMARKLRVYLFEAAPRDADGHRPSALVLLRAALEGERRGEQPEWLRPEAIPVLMQLLMHEDASLRALLVDLLAEIPGTASTDALAHRAVFDLDQSIRDRAVAALRDRPLEEVRPVFFNGLRYPWAPAADHAAEALVALNDVSAAPELVNLLSEPDPAAPISGRKEQKYVREVVRVHHLSQCLLCHPPSITYADPSPGVVPALTWNYPVPDQSTAAVLQTSVSQTTSTIFGASASSAGCHHYAVDPNVATITVPLPPARRPFSRGTPRPVSLQTTITKSTQAVRPTTISTVRLPVLVRGDITYFKQDFSITQPVPQPGNPIPFNARFDYLVRIRPLTPQEVQKLAPPSPGQASYPQRDAVLFALRELTGKDVGVSAEAWQDLYPAARTDHKAKHLGDNLVAAPQKKFAAILAELQQSKGAVYTEALAYAIPKLVGNRNEKAREALAERLTRMTVATLADKLESDDVEIRSAAIEATVRKERKTLIPNLIALLQDEEVGPKALKALQQLAGQRFVAKEDWKDWWQDQGVN
jgi:HEAT repeat protein